jgi:hypothetical protein
MHLAAIFHPTRNEEGNVLSCCAAHRTSVVQCFDPQEQAAVLQAMSLADYSALKTRLLLTTALLTLGGSGVAAIASGVDAAVPFAIGGMAGLLYQLLLQLGADAAVATAATKPDAAAAQQGRGAGSSSAAVGAQQGFQSRVVQLLGSSAMRLALLTSAALLALWAVQDSGELMLQLLSILQVTSAAGTCRRTCCQLLPHDVVPFWAVS